MGARDNFKAVNAGFDRGAQPAADETSSHSSENEESETGQYRHCNHTLSVEEIFARDSTTGLIKKYFVYKLMGSNFFVNHALTAMKFCYRVLGIPPTNLMINTSVGDLFTSGETLQTLKKDIRCLLYTSPSPRDRG